MRRTSPFYTLEALVESRWPGSPRWETIAAFNSTRVAIDYADQCAATHEPMRGKPWGYRVQTRVKNAWTTLHESPVNYGMTPLKVT